MKRYDEIKLVSEAPAAHGVLETPVTVQRTVPCEVKSVGMKETYTAMSQGLSPSIVFVLALAEEYDEERRVVYHDVVYRIVRTYNTNDGGIELTCERVTGDV